MWLTVPYDTIAVLNGSCSFLLSYAFETMGLLFLKHCATSALYNNVGVYLDVDVKDMKISI